MKPLATAIPKRMTEADLADTEKRLLSIVRFPFDDDLARLMVEVRRARAAERELTEALPQRQN